MALSRSLTLSVLALSLTATGLAACDRQSGSPAQPEATASTAAPETPPGKLDRSRVDRSHRGNRLPDLALHGPDGRQLRLTSLTGKPLLLNLWATWCGPCVAELPTLRRLADAKAGRIAVVAVSQDLGDSATVSAFWKAHGFAPWPLWLDPDNAATSHYQIGEMPTTIFYDAQGREVWRMVGAHDWAGADTKDLIAPAMP